jgi:alpha-glucosidase
MNVIKKFSFFFMLMGIIPAFAQNNIQLKSPDGQIVFSFKLTEKAPVYRVGYKGKILINDSELSLSFKGSGTFGSSLKMSKARFREVDENYELVVGKAKIVKDQHREVVIPLFEVSEAKRQINLVVRAFNDGLAFRYEFPEQKNWTSYNLTDENSTFNIAGNPTVRALFFGNYTSSHETLYQKLPLSEIKADTLMDMPALFEFPEKIYMAITEANLRNYAGMYLMKQNGVLKSQLSPLPSQNEIKVNATLPHRSPWRVMMISDRIGSLIESNILTSLNEPTKIKDLSWLKPGKTSFHWWNGDITPDTTFAPGVNFDTNKYYIDFCARNKIEYHSVIGYGGFAWYQSDAPGYGEVGPNTKTDVTRTVASLDMQQVCDYARQKGVGIHVWVHWKALYPQLEEAFIQFEKWGIKGMMVDFLDRDDQEIVNIQEEILKKAAEHKLFIQFHGAYKPTGLHRTYPNEFTREGTYNYEQNKWNSEGISPDHDINIPFTRMLAGATDYHLGGFRAVAESKFKTQLTRPLMIGTRCHMMAMYVVLESYLAMVADFPSAYEGQPGFEFLQKVPTSWDETIVPAAAVGEYVTIARRKGTDWYVGSINNSKARAIKLSLGFLPPGNYSAELYSDAADAETNPNHLIKQIKTVTNEYVFILKLAAGGGQVMRITKR